MQFQGVSLLWTILDKDVLLFSVYASQYRCCHMRHIYQQRRKINLLCGYINPETGKSKLLPYCDSCIFHSISVSKGKRNDVRNFHAFNHQTTMNQYKPYQDLIMWYCLCGAKNKHIGGFFFSSNVLTSIYTIESSDRYQYTSKGNSASILSVTRY